MFDPSQHDVIISRNILPIKMNKFIEVKQSLFRFQGNRLAVHYNFHNTQCYIENILLTEFHFVKYFSMHEVGKTFLCYPSTYTFPELLFSILYLDIRKAPDQ